MLPNQVMTFNDVILFIHEKTKASVSNGGTTALPPDIIRRWFPEEQGRTYQLITKHMAYDMLRKVKEIGFCQTEPPSHGEGSSKEVCTYAKFEYFYNRIIGNRKWCIVNKPSDIMYNTDYASMLRYRINATVIGGGSGGAGSVCGYTVKNAPHGMYGSVGVAGEDSYIYSNGPQLNAVGGAETAYSYLYANKKDGWSYGNGVDGNSGSSVTGDAILYYYVTLSFHCGYGGGGGGAVAGYRGDVQPGQANANGSGSDGGNAGQIGTNQAGVWGGGGGGNASRVSSAGSYNGQRPAQVSQAPQKYLGQFTRGSNTATVGSNPNGAGGAGRAGLRDNPQPALNGGEGGNSGAIYINSVVIDDTGEPVDLYLNKLH